MSSTLLDNQFHAMEDGVTSDSSSGYDLFGERPTEVYLTAKDMCYNVGEIEILKNINLVARPNELIALMGPSGAGKTTLLNVLSYRAGGEVTGEVLMNGKSLELRQCRMISNFIPQDDILLPALTPRQTLEYACKLRLGLSDQESREKVNLILETLSLTICQDVQIGEPGIAGGCSGGQRKRVSIGLELVTNPSILFVDEPTSGLDSKTAHDVVSLLAEIAHRGRTVICTVHQPSFLTFQLFDRLLLLVRGQIAYLGPISGAMAYFTKQGFPFPSYANPADYLMELLQQPLQNTIGNKNTHLEMKQVNHDNNHNNNHNTTDESHSNTNKSVTPSSLVMDKLGEPPEIAFPAIWKDSDSGSQELNEPDYKALTETSKLTGYQVSMPGQIWALFCRAVRTTVFDKAQLRVRLSTTTFVALLIGLIYLHTDSGIEQSEAQDRQSTLFMCIFFSVMDSCLSTVGYFPTVRAVLFREYKNGYYQLMANYLSRVCVTILFQMLYSLIFAGVIYSMVGMYPNFGNFLVFYSTVCLEACIGCVLGLTVGAAVPNVILAQAMVPPTLMPLIVFSGFLQKPDNIAVYFKWLYHLSFFQYGFQVLTVNEWDDRTMENCSLDEAQQQKCPFGVGEVDGGVMIESLDFNSDHLQRNVWILMGFLSGFIVLGYYVTKHQARKRTS